MRRKVTHFLQKCAIFTSKSLLTQILCCRLSLFLAQHFLGALAIGNDVYAGLLWPFINCQSA